MQLFYAWRIYRLSSWRIVPIVVVVVRDQFFLVVAMSRTAPNLFYMQTALAQAVGAWIVAIEVSLPYYDYCVRPRLN